MVVIQVGFILCSADAPEGKRTACYDIELEIVSRFFYRFVTSETTCTFSNSFVQDDPLKASMHSFLMSGQNMQEIGMFDNKVHSLTLLPSMTAPSNYDYTRQIHETVEQINATKLQREFYLGFSDNPQKFINDWLASQNRDLKVCLCRCGLL